MQNKMKYFLIIAVLLFISATPVEVTHFVIQPKVPTSVKVMRGYLGVSNASSVESALNTYTKMGYIVKTSDYNSNGNYLIILEKY